MVTDDYVDEGEKVLNRAVKAHKVSESGIKAFLAAVDPFHDKPIEGLRGWPDLETGPSVIRKWKNTTTVKAIEDGGAVLVYTWPILNDAICNPVVRRNSVVDTITTGVTTQMNIAPTVIYNLTKAQADALVIPNSNMQTFAHSVDDSYFGDGPVRIIGMGVEIQDVTADIYRQGTITTFQVPQSTADTEEVVVRAQTVSAVNYIQTPVQICKMFRYPPSLADMMKYPDTRQWAAREGAYIVVPFTGHENPAEAAEYRTPWINTTGSLPIDTPDTLNTTARHLGPYASGSVSGDNFIFLAHHYAPVHSRGAYITGLNANSTFTITTVFYLETFPLQSSPLVSLAQPSCPFDPKALALISLTMQRMPVAVPYSENPNGEWFWEAVESALPVLGTVASALFPEFSPLIGGAAAAGTKYAAERLADNKRKKAKKKENAQKMRNQIDQRVKQDLALAQQARAKK